MKMPNKHSAPRARLSLRDGGMPVAPTVPDNWTDSVFHVADVGGNLAANSLRSAFGVKPTPAPIDYPGNMAKIKQMMQPPIDGVQPLTPRAAPARPPVDPNNPAGIQFNSGGDVPGRGKGDKIPAMYEPGEFVVSNDMLDDEPELRGELHELREKVLAKKGMTPEEADEKAMKPGRGLRAQAGFGLVPMGDLREVPRPPGTSLARTMDNGYRPNFTMGGNAPAAPAMAAPGNPNVGAAGSAEARAWQASRAAPAAPAAAAAPAAQTGLRGAIARTGSGALGAAARFAPSALGADVISHFNDYKLNDPEVDSSAGGTFKAIGEGDFAGAGRSLSKGLLETGMDLGSTAANLADYVVPGKAPVSTAYNKMLRGAFGDQLAVHPSAEPPAPSAMRPAQSPPVQGTADQSPTAQNPAMPEGKINVTTQPNGVTSFSGQNITGTPEYTGAAAQGLRGGSVNSMPAAQFTSSGFGDNDAALSAARQAAAARGDFDSVRASYGPQGGRADELAGLRALASNPDAIGHNGAARLLTALTNDATARRGQDMAREDARANQDSTARTAGLRLQYDMGKDNRDYQRNVDSDNFTQGQAAQKAVTDEVASYVPPGPDGKPDMVRTSQMMKALNAHVAGRKSELERHLQLNPGDKAAASELAGLEKRGVAMMDAGAKRKFIEGQMAVDAGAAGETAIPFVGSKMVEGDAPIRSLRREETLFGHDYRTNRGDVIPGRAIDKTGSFLGLGGRRNTNFDNIIEK